MPLDCGIDDYRDYRSIAVQPGTLFAMFDVRDQILAFFRANPALLRRPYDAKRLASGLWVHGAANDNPIWKMLALTGLKMTQLPALSAVPSWKEAKFIDAGERIPNAQGYALVDVALYLVHLLNVYLPNETLIKNLYATNVEENALGEENLTAAVKAIGRVWMKSTGVPASNPFVEPRSRDLALLARYALANHETARAYPRGVGFERNCLAKLVEAGFEVQTTPTTGDYGADLIAEKDELGYAIQCKDTSKPVGVKAVQEAVAARAHYKTDFAAVCSSGGFTDAAIELASSNRVILCNLDQLARRLDAV